MDETRDWFGQLLKAWGVVAAGWVVVMAFAIPNILVGAIVGAVIEGAGVLWFLYAVVRWALAMRAVGR